MNPTDTFQLSPTAAPTDPHEAHATIASLVEEHGDDLAFVVNISGGKDSMHMLGVLKARYPKQKMYVVMADTGFEHVRPVPAVEWARQQASRFGQELHVVRNPNKTYLEMVERRGKFPSAAARTCTSDLKRSCVSKMIRHLPEKVIVNCTGIRADESHARAKQIPWKFDNALSKAGRQVWSWMPIFEATLEQVIRWHWTEGHPLHPVYVPEYHADGKPGGYLNRFSCRMCIFSTDADIRAIYIHDREAFDLVASLEERIGFTMKNGKSLFQIIGQQTAHTLNPTASLFESDAAPCSL